MSDLFDNYARRARLYPALLTVLPGVAIVAVIWPKSPLVSILPIFVSVGGLFFLADWVRDNGKALEDRLAQRWDGMPTTRMLRHRDRQLFRGFDRRRDLLSTKTDITLPTAQEELTHASAADDEYITATKSLIAKVRSKRQDFPRVQEELTHYGFRRNLLSMKPFGLPIAIACVVFDVVWGAVISDSVVVALLVVHTLVTLAWISVVQPSWVRRQADTYAERLFETLEDPRL